MEFENAYQKSLEAARRIAEDPNHTSLFHEVVEEEVEKVMQAIRKKIKETSKEKVFP